MKFMENKKLAARIGIITTIITLAGMAILWRFVSTNAASVVKNDITNQMTDAVEARASIIDAYVLSAEEYMTAFALGGEVRALLLNPDDPELLAQAQKYTEDFAAVKGVFEGLYIATPETHVLTHTSQGAIGMTTRSGDSLKTFQNTILARQELTNSGIMQSPGTGSMILSMYYPIFEDQRCIGYVGAGVYASHLMDSLLNLNIKGLPDSEYVFLNVETGVYLYHEDETLLNTSTTESGYLEILRRIQEDGGTQANTYSYRDEAGVRQLVVYKYLRDRGWVFMVRDNATEVYGAVTMVRVLVGVMCAVTAAAVILITLLILRREGRELMVVERAIGRLGDLNLSADQELEPFYGRSDEIGMIAQTTHGVCSCLRKTIDDVGRILGEMAQGTTEQASSVEGLMENVTSITAQIQTSAVRCGSATQQVGLATSYAAEADTRMEQLTTATQHIDQSSTQIGTIINTIEDIAFQTSILALNAAVEAARAGAAGKGFAVVADEVRNLASKSDEAAKATKELIEGSIASVREGGQVVRQVTDSLDKTSAIAGNVTIKVNSVVESVEGQTTAISQVTEGINQISAVVQITSAATEKSAATAQELSDQSRLMNELARRFRLD